MAGYEPVISALVLGEIRATLQADTRDRLEALVESFPVLTINSAAEALADEYVGRGAIRDKFRDDALHIAIAVAHQISLMASWNFRHLVKLQVRRQINLINALLGYGQIEIVSPPEL
jgi:hypothetical protein